MKKKDIQALPTLAEVAQMSKADQVYWKKRGVKLGPVVQGRIIFNPGPEFMRTLKNKKQDQKLTGVEREQVISTRAAQSLRQAQAMWKKMNLKYPANLLDHVAMERLLAEEEAVTNAFFVKGAVIISVDPDQFNESEAERLVDYFPMAFQGRYHVISDFSKRPLTLYDGEKLLELAKSIVKYRSRTIRMGEQL